MTICKKWETKSTFFELRIKILDKITPKNFHKLQQCQILEMLNYESIQQVL